MNLVSAEQTCSDLGIFPQSATAFWLGNHLILQNQPDATTNIDNANQWTHQNGTKIQPVDQKWISFKCDQYQEAIFYEDETATIAPETVKRFTCERGFDGHRNGLAYFNAESILRNLESGMVNFKDGSDFIFRYSLSGESVDCNCDGEGKWVCDLQF